MKKINLENLYEDQWVQNTGGTTVHAKRIPGWFRNAKWLSMLIWLPFFLLPYLNWYGRQAILLDVENRKYHLFDITIFPQDVWLLTFLLLFLAILLAAVTTILGRVFCGYMCFQTVWTDIFTWIESKIEGDPNKRKQLDSSKMNSKKLYKKTLKHIIWISIALLSGGTWMLYFGVSWDDYINMDISTTTLAFTSGIAGGVYIFAGFMREQTCLWICPYARIQGVMVDDNTLMPTYDYIRGEKRGKIKKTDNDDSLGDCIDCYQCVAVCPTGVDIRNGQEYGCITCGLCIDACDSVMEKVGRPKGLIRYASLENLESQTEGLPLYKRTRVIAYVSVLILSLSTIVYGLMNIEHIDVKVLHGRTPIFIQLSDGSIRNKYEVKILNKTEGVLKVDIRSESSIINLKTKGFFKDLSINPGQLKTQYIYLTTFSKNVLSDNQVRFIISSKNKDDIFLDSKFFTPNNIKY
jgi:cytochrome c oxidase accessory protein FixG